MRRSLLRLAACTLGPGLALLAAGGCAGYRSGSLMHPQIERVAVGSFRNDTEEPGLSTHLRQTLTEAFLNDGSVRVTDAAGADVVVEGRILRYTMDRVAASKISDDRQDGRSTYQTTIFEARVEIEFEVRMPGLRRPVLDRRSLSGTAQYAELPDFAVARNEGLRRAVQDAAVQIAAAVTEGW
jgi:hypothetical protein